MTSLPEKYKEIGIAVLIIGFSIWSLFAFYEPTITFKSYLLMSAILLTLAVALTLKSGDGMITRFRTISPENDRRHANRIPYRTSVAYANDSKNGLGTIQDISADGVFLQTSGLFDVGEKISLKFKFRHGQNKRNILGEVVRIAKKGVGIKFE